MKRTDYPSYVELASWLFCAFLSRGLFVDLEGFPLLNWGKTAFFLWFLPILIYWFYPYITKGRHVNAILLSGGVFVSLFGLLGELNALKHVGFIIATAAFLPFSWKHFLWVLSAFSWLPASAYFLSTFSFDLVAFSRLLLASLGSLIALWGLYSEKLLLFPWKHNEK